MFGNMGENLHIILFYCLCSRLCCLCCAGELILNVDKDTYEKMGLEGKPSQFNGKRRRKYGEHAKLSV